MKKHKIFYTTCLTLLLVSGTSCKKWLSLSPLDGITRQEYWKTKEDVRTAVTGVYTSLFNGGQMSQTIFMYGELRADMVIATASAASMYSDVENVNILPTNPLVSWASLYNTINSCNIVLQYAPPVKALDPTLTDGQLNSYLGEMLAMRSLMYFYLVRTYRDVPLKLTPSATDADIVNVGKTPGYVVLKQLVADLKLAETYLPTSYNALNSTSNIYSPVLSKGHFTSISAAALLADVYLWMQDDADAVVECDKVINFANSNPDKVGLINGNVSTTWWQSIFGNGSSIETLFEFNQGTTLANPFYPLLSISYAQQFLATNYVNQNFFPLDPNNPNGNDVRLNAYYNPMDLVISKWGMNRAAPTYTNWQVYRYPDVLLIKAEAMVSLGRGAESLQIISTIRNSRNALASTLETPAPTDNNGVYQYILDERSREFAFEGKRWFDLLRFARRNKYANIGLLTDMVGRTVIPSLQQTAVTKYLDTNSHYLPINQADLFSDPTLIQNPFYK